MAFLQGKLDRLIVPWQPIAQCSSLPASQLYALLQNISSSLAFVKVVASSPLSL